LLWILGKLCGYGETNSKLRQTLYVYLLAPEGSILRTNQKPAAKAPTAVSKNRSAKERSLSSSRQAAIPGAKTIVIVAKTNVIVRMLRFIVGTRFIAALLALVTVNSLPAAKSLTKSSGFTGKPVAIANAAPAQADANPTSPRPNGNAIPYITRTTAPALLMSERPAAT
jgi:hypothetical protein